MRSWREGDIAFENSRRGFFENDGVAIPAVERSGDCDAGGAFFTGLEAKRRAVAGKRGNG